MRLRACALLAALSGMSAGAWAQSDFATGSIAGRATDATGAVVPGANIEAVNNDNGFRRGDTSDGSGRYRLDQLPPGVYRVTARLEGFETVERPGITVALGVRAAVDFRLAPAAVAEQLVISAQAPLVDARRTDASENVNEVSIKTLPLNGRRFTDLVTLTPHAVRNGDRVDVGGQRGIQNSFNIDGASAQSTFFGEQLGGFGPPFFFSQESIQEFQVVSSSYQAQYGNATGGIINAVTKSGTNELHGSAFFYFRNNGLSDRDANGLAPSRFEAKQFGGTFGGPVLRDRLHFFLAYDGQRKTAPTESQYADSTADHALSNPSNRQFLLDHGYDIDADSGTIPRGDDVDVPFAKLDAQVSNGSSLSLRENYLRWQALSGTSSNTANAFRNGESNRATDSATSNSLAASFAAVVCPSIFDDVTFQAAYENRPRIPNSTRFPETRIGSNASDWTFGQIFFAPSGLTDRRWQLVENAAGSFGDHQPKAGFDVSRDDYIDPFLVDAGGVFTFNSWDDLFAGTPQRYEQGFSTTGGRVKYRQWLYAVYLQDEWQASPRLTVNGGIRYEYQREPSTLNVNRLDSRTGHFPRDHRDWAPRLGFAWDVEGDHRTVVRGGMGVFYVPTPSLLVANVFLNDGVSNAVYQLNTVDAPVWPNRLTEPPAGLSPSKPNISIADPAFRNTRTVRATLGAEREVAADFAVGLELGYSRTRFGERIFDDNLLAVGSTADGRPRYGSIDPATGRVAVARPNPNFNRIQDYVSDAEGSYGAVSVTIRKRLTGWWQMQGFYTWARSRDESSNERTISIGGGAPENVYDVGADRGDSDYDVRHNFLLASTENLPWGITVAEIFDVHSGLPFSALAGYDVNADGITGHDRANRSFDPTTGQPAGKHFGRNTFRNPTVETLDVTIEKTFRVASVADVSVILQGFNLLHSSNRTVPGTNQIYYTVDRGRVTGYNPNFGRATQASFANARQFQLGARLAF